MTIFKTACVQISSQDDMEANIESACQLITEASEGGAKFITTPENVAYMAASNKDLFDNSYYQKDHPALLKFQELADKLNIYLLIGSLAIKSKTHKGKLYNRSFLIDDKGKISCQYDKIHLYKADLPNDKHYQESDTYIAGNECKISVLPWGKLGMSICYDLRFPHLYRHLAKSGAVFISIPSAFTDYTGKAHWEVLLRARAIENGCFIFAPAQTEQHPANLKTYGHSLIINPWGEVIADADDEEGIIIADIDTQLVMKSRSHIASLKHDRDFN